MSSSAETSSTDLEGECVLVTGAGGYIGSMLVVELISRGANVRAVDRFFFGLESLSPNLEDARLSIIKKDIRDVTVADMEGVTSVLDLAALSNDPSGDLDPELTRSINRDGRINIAGVAKEAGVARYVLSSTCSVYGAAEQGFSDETTPPNPVSVYAKSNYEAEQAVFGLASPDFSVTALRNATVFGVSHRMRFDLVVNLMTLNAFERGSITIMGGGKQWRPLVHVRDVGRAMIALLLANPGVVNGKAYNLGVGNYQVRTIAAIVREILPITVQLQIAPDDPDRRNYRVSFDRLKNEVGFEARTTIEDGVREIYDGLKFGTVENTPRCSTVQWYKHILEAKRLLSDIELDGRLL
jgi:nucleoside-diphosphate-sugar epimerase